MSYYNIEDCDRVLEKLANMMQDPAAAQAQGMPADGSQPLGTIGASMGGGQGAPQGAPAGGGEGGMKVNKDQLYERLIQEKDNHSKLKVQLAASGQLPQEVIAQDQMQQGPPLEQQMQEGMSQEMAAQQQGMPPGQDPAAMAQGLQVQAAALKKKLEKDFLDKEAIAPLALAAGAANAYGLYQLGRGAVDLAGGVARYVGNKLDPRETLAKAKMGFNPLITRDVMEQEFRRQPFMSDSGGFGSLGRRESSQNLFGPGPSIPQSFTNKYAPNTTSSPGGGAHKADYNGVGR